MADQKTSGKPGFKITKFIPEVRQELSRVVWPSRKETVTTTIFVFVLAFIAAIYFTLVDSVIHKFVSWVIDLGIN